MANSRLQRDLPLPHLAELSERFDKILCELETIGRIKNQTDFAKRVNARCSDIYENMGTEISVIRKGKRLPIQDPIMTRVYEELTALGIPQIQVTQLKEFETHARELGDFYMSILPTQLSTSRLADIEGQIFSLPIVWVVTKTLRSLARYEPMKKIVAVNFDRDVHYEHWIPDSFSEFLCENIEIVRSEWPGKLNIHPTRTEIINAVLALRGEQMMIFNPYGKLPVVNCLVDGVEEIWEESTTTAEKCQELERMLRNARAGHTLH